MQVTRSKVRGASSASASAEIKRYATLTPLSSWCSFATLNEYLAFLEERGATDVPWFREIRPGVYEVVTRRPPGAEPQIFTREELMEQFGFTR